MAKEYEVPGTGGIVTVVSPGSAVLAVLTVLGAICFANGHEIVGGLFLIWPLWIVFAAGAVIMERLDRIAPKG